MSKSRILKIEQRAAELGMYVGDPLGVGIYWTLAERTGWSKHRRGRDPVGDGQWTGWLAREVFWQNQLT